MRRHSALQLVGGRVLQTGVDAELHAGSLARVTGRRTRSAVGRPVQWPDARGRRLARSSAIPCWSSRSAGWVDAGMAGAGTRRRCSREQLGRGPRVRAASTSSTSSTCSRRGPTVELVDGDDPRRSRGRRSSSSPGAPGATSSCAPGPNRRCGGRRSSRELVAMARRLGVQAAYGLGGDARASRTHRRPVSGARHRRPSAGSPSEVGALRTDYAGRDRAADRAARRARRGRHPGVGLWAQVPHYVAGNPSPPAIRAVLERLRELAGIECDLNELDERGRRLRGEGGGRPRRAPRCRRARAGDRGRAPRSCRAATTSPSEIERFLRSRPDGVTPRRTSVPADDRPGQGRPAAPPGTRSRTGHGRGSRSGVGSRPPCHEDSESSMGAL